jgi:hypothetical protein
VQDAPFFADDHDPSEKSIKRRRKSIGFNLLHVEDVDDLHRATDMRHQQANCCGVLVHQGVAILVSVGREDCDASRLAQHDPFASHR